MSTATKPTVRELRRSAKTLGITGWEEMDEAALTAAVTAAEGKAAKTRSTRTSTAAAKKVAAAPVAKTAAVKKAAVVKDGAVKTPAVKKAVKVAATEELPENGNPFKDGTNMFLITEELIKGGKRSAMVARLNKKIQLAPRSKDAKEFDVEYEMDRRILITGQILRNQHAFVVEREGRGADATIQATAP